MARGGVACVGTCCSSPPFACVTSGWLLGCKECPPLRPAAPPPRPPGSGAPSGCRHRVSATSRLPAATLTVHPLLRHSGGLTTGPVTPRPCKTAPCRDCLWGRPEACAGVLQRLGPLGTARPRPLRRAGALGSHSAHTSDLRPQAFKKKAAGSSLPSLSLRRGGPPALGRASRLRPRLLGRPSPRRTLFC